MHVAGVEAHAVSAPALIKNSITIAVAVAAFALSAIIAFFLIIIVIVVIVFIVEQIVERH